MDYKECLKVHGYIAEKSDSENESSNVEEIYNRYKPPPVPYDEFKHCVITIYADNSTASQSNNRAAATATSRSRSRGRRSSKTFLNATLTVNPSATVQQRTTRCTPPHVPAVARPGNNVHSMLQQQQLDQFTNSYQQRTDTPIRDILTRPHTVQPATPRASVVVAVPPPQPAQSARVYTVTPPPPPAPAPVSNIPVHNSRTEHRSAYWEQPPPPPSPSPSNDVQVPYQPLVASQCATSQSGRRRDRRPRRSNHHHHHQQQQEEEMNNCCCCIC